MLGTVALAALVDALLPAAEPFDGGRRYPAASGVGLDRQVAELVETLPAKERKEFGTLLYVVDSRFQNLLLSGRPTRFSSLSSVERERYLRAWSRSRMSAKRKGFQSIKRLAVGLYFSQPIDGASNPLWERIHYELPEVPEASSTPVAGVEPIRPSGDVDEVVDVCVIGSGAGGSVIAARAAQAGLRVVILESGPWVPRSNYPRMERDAYHRLFLGQGLVTNVDHSIVILAGGTVGGGTAVNWMTCLPPRPEARTEWATEGGMVGVDGPDFDRAYRAISDRLEVSTAESDRNPSNDALRRGCEALGYRQGPDWDVIARNAAGCNSRCGFCTFGCPYSARRSTLTTFLADACARGARLYASTRAEHVEVREGRVTGVAATYREGPRTSRVHVKARAVVAAAGALETPALLLRSGLRSAGIGVGLRLDPTTALAAEFPFPVRTWAGPPQTIGVYRFQTSDAGAHGPWIEVAPAHPGLAAVAFPWEGATEFRRNMERLERVATPIVLVRDVAEGRVRVDEDGRPEVEYTLSSRDRRNLVRGVVETARILQAAGAVRITSLHTPLVEVGDGTRSVSPSELDRFTSEVESRGIRENSVGLFSAHPLGSARAGMDPRRSAAGPTGEVHDVHGLWIGDGSILPSAPGSNPMMSIMSVAWRTSDALLASLHGRSGSGPG